MVLGDSSHGHLGSRQRYKGSRNMMRNEAADSTVASKQNRCTVPERRGRGPDRVPKGMYLPTLHRYQGECFIDPSGDSRDNQIDPQTKPSYSTPCQLDTQHISLKHD